MLATTSPFAATSARLFPVSRLDCAMAEISKTFALAPGYTAEDLAFAREHCSALFAFWRATRPRSPLDLNWLEGGLQDIARFREAARDASNVTPLMVARLGHRGHLRDDRDDLLPLYRQAIIVIESLSFHFRNEVPAWSN